MVTMWHPESPGSRVTVWVPWWGRKRRLFATLSQTLRSHRPTFDAVTQYGR